MLINFKSKWLYLLLVILLFSSCIKEEINTDDIVLEEYSPTVAFSIGEANFKISDITGTRDLETEVVNFLNEIYPSFDYSSYLDNFNLTLFPFIIQSRNINLALKFPFNGEDFFSFSDSLKQFKVKFIMENGIPTNFNTQIYFLDENNTLVDSLFSLDQQRYEQGITKIENDGTNTYHRLINGEKNIKSINTLEKISILKKAKSIIIRFTGQKLEETNKVLIEESNYLNFKIGLLIEDNLAESI
jgi:hypothetical protein